MELSCKRCGSTLFVKRGFGRGLQRYRGKTCGFHFTGKPKRAPGSDQGLGAGQADVLLGEQALIFILLSCK
jgi:hypothetical protein